MQYDEDDVTKEILQSTTASIVADIKEVPTSKLMLFPNPSVENNTNLVIETPERGDFEIMLINTLGEIVMLDNIIVSSDITVYNLDNTALSNGIYNVVVTSKSTKSTKKLQILR